jgi:hypothetical protein
MSTCSMAEAQAPPAPPATLPELETKAFEPNVVPPIRSFLALSAEKVP